MNPRRYAIVTVPVPGDPEAILRTVLRFLPSNYSATLWRNDARGFDVLIHGEDSAGWTLHGYVIPRLASGLIFAAERSVEDVFA